MTGTTQKTTRRQASNTPIILVHKFNQSSALIIIADIILGADLIGIKRLSGCKAGIGQFLILLVTP
jgi:hypothetical protein